MKDILDTGVRPILPIPKRVEDLKAAAGQPHNYDRIDWGKVRAFTHNKVRRASTCKVEGTSKRPFADIAGLKMKEPRPSVARSTW